MSSKLYQPLKQSKAFFYPLKKPFIFYVNSFQHTCFAPCSFDYLKIADEKNQIIAVYCGQRSGRTVYVTGQYAEISFHTDGSVQERGYELFFSHNPIGR